MREKWIYAFRNMLANASVSDANFTDEEVLKIGRGLVAPVFSDQITIGSEWAYKLYFEAFIAIQEPPEDLMEGVDMELLKAKLKDE